MRTSGVLLPVFSLPSPHGIGCFSKEAYEWVDFLKLAGQQYWQILPLGPTSYGDSPYQSFSTYAGNPYFIDLEELVEAADQRQRRHLALMRALDTLSERQRAAVVEYYIFRQKTKRTLRHLGLNRLREKHGETLKEFL